MRRVWMWFWLSGKRYLSRLSFLLILLVLPLGTFLIRNEEEKGPVQIRIALYAQAEEITEKKTEESEKGSEEYQEVLEQQESLEQQLAEVLIRQNGEESLFQFYVCENEEQVREEVASRKAECGYVICSKLREKLKQKDFKRSIQVYSAPSTVAARLSTETVFAAMIQLYDQELFREYAEKNTDVSSAQADQLYERWKENGSTFRFTYETVKKQENAVDEETADFLFPVRGIAAVYVFIIGLYGAVMNLSDEKRGLFRAIPYGWRTPCRLSAMAAPVCLAALSGMAALWTGKCQGSWMEELTAMTVYVLAVILFAWVIRLLCRREEIICCLIPLFLAGSLIFCPIFLDIRRYIPEFAVWEKLFLPSYYIRWF